VIVLEIPEKIRAYVVHKWKSEIIGLNGQNYLKLQQKKVVQIMQVMDKKANKCLEMLLQSSSDKFSRKISQMTAILI
jgi:hypothetical protein